jgi:feruloyl esterase
MDRSVSRSRARKRSDYTVNPRAVMAYYDRVVQTLGARTVDQFMRFYVAVGLFHNRNIGRNPVTNELVPMYVDFISMLDDWVENGKVPADTQVLTDMNQLPPFAVNATFPMCRYPMYPRYTSKGDTRRAESYVCVK